MLKNILIKGNKILWVVGQTEERGTASSTVKSSFFLRKTAW